MYTGSQFFNVKARGYRPLARVRASSPVAPPETSVPEVEEVLPTSHGGTRRRFDRVPLKWLVQPSVGLAKTPASAVAQNIKNPDFMAHFFLSVLHVKEWDYRVFEALLSASYQTQYGNKVCIKPRVLFDAPTLTYRRGASKFVVSEDIDKFLILNDKNYRSFLENFELPQAHVGKASSLHNVGTEIKRVRRRAKSIAESQRDKVEHMQSSSSSSSFVPLFSSATNAVKGACAFATELPSMASAVTEDIADLRDSAADMCDAFEESAAVLQTTAENVAETSSAVCDFTQRIHGLLETAVKFFNDSTSSLLEGTTDTTSEILRPGLLMRIVKVVGTEILQLVVQGLSWEGVGFACTRLAALLDLEITSVVCISVVMTYVCAPSLFRSLRRLPEMISQFFSSFLPDFALPEAHGDNHATTFFSGVAKPFVQAVQKTARVNFSDSTIEKHIANFVKLGNVSRSCLSLQTFYEKCLKDMILDVIAWTTGVPRPDVLCPEVQQEVVSFFQEVDAWCESSVLHKKYKDYSYHRTIMTLSHQLQSYKRRLLVPGSDKPHVKTLEAAFHYREKKIETAFNFFASAGFDYDKTKHAEPVSVFLTSPPGVGKTTLLKLIVTCILQLKGTKVKDVEDHIYRRVSTSEYWSGYRNQFATIFEEFGALVDSTQKPNPNFLDLLNIYTDSTVPLNMASIAEKAATFFSSPLILASCNTLPVPVSLMAPTALERRIDLFCEISINPPPNLVSHFSTRIDDKGNSYYTPSIDPMETLACTEITIVRTGSDMAGRRVAKATKKMNLMPFMKLVSDLMDDKVAALSRMTSDFDGYAKLFVATYTPNPLGGLTGGTSSSTSSTTSSSSSSTSSHTSSSSSNFYPPDFFATMDEHFFDCKSTDSEAFNCPMPLSDVDTVERAGPLPLTAANLMLLRDSVNTGTESVHSEVLLETLQAIRDQRPKTIFDDSESPESSEGLDRVREAMKWCSSYKGSALLTTGVLGFFSLAFLTKTLIDAFRTKPLAVAHNNPYDAPEDSASTCSSRSSQRHWEAREWRRERNAQIDADLDCYYDKVVYGPDYRLGHGGGRLKNASVAFSDSTKEWDGRRSALKKTVAEAQGLELPKNAQDFMDVLKMNLYSIWVDRVGPNTGSRLGSLLFIRGNCAITFGHVLPTLGAVGGFTLLRGNTEIGMPIPFNAVRVIRDTDLQNFDLVLVVLPSMHIHRDITSNFATKEDLARFPVVNLALVALRHDRDRLPMMEVLQLRNAICKPTHALRYRCKEEIKSVAGHIEYDGEVMAADCGSPLLAWENRIQRKIYGFHICGFSDRAVGYGTAPPREMILKALDGVDTKYQIKKGELPVFLPATNIDHYEVEDEHQVSHVNCPVRISTQLAVEGMFTRAAIVADTAIVRSPLHGKIITKDGHSFGPHKSPARLKPFTNDKGERVHPFLKAIEKNATAPVYVDEGLVEESVAEVFSNFDTEIKFTQRRVLTWLEAAKGVEDDPFIRAVDRSKSAGFPRSFDPEAGNGKYKDLGKDDVWFISPELQAELDQIEAKARSNERVEAVFVETLKDERRPREKVAAGKTRVFSAAPLGFLLAFRRYFAPFLSHVMANRVVNGVAVGINPYSEWTQLARKMQSKGPHVIAGDFEGFDGSLQRFILHAIGEAIIAWFDDPDNAMIRRVLWSQITDSTHLVFNLFVAWSHGLPSGNPITAILNSIYVLVVKRMVWKMNVPREMRTRYTDYVYSIAYGDDNMDNVSPDAMEYFSQFAQEKSFPLLGMKLTSETKEASVVSSRALTEVTFLKRGFALSEQGEWLAPLDKETIEDMCHWTTKGAMGRGNLGEVVRIAYREASLHPLYYYNRFGQALRIAVRACGAIPEKPPFYEHVEQRRLVMHPKDGIVERPPDGRPMFLE